MKTVIDAVNELRADVESNARPNKYGYLGFDGWGEWVTCTSSYHRKVCSIEEFDQCVKEMSEAKWIPEKAVFTQEFAVNGRSSIPLVWKPCIVKYSGSKYVVVVDSDGREYSRKKS